ncbi:EamA family transporter [Mucilaginibacter robiniae]|uniref:EamA family transporter n=1 Tax=Mucilaginibacter robiniae TaxID=2728022 RepID=A0A7L5E4B0_9SPHI|nr:DMT family transporter [Mucilaginibacter robiniae]QJD97915.1 EamA family transporter [Mucilaginibacter robiniae]
MLNNKSILLGLLFAILWATGSVAFKLGLRSADPLILATMRFVGTGILFGHYFLINKKYRFRPNLVEWKAIAIYGLLNTTLTLGSFSAAQRYASAGISMLFIAITPLVIALLSSIFLERKLKCTEVAGMLLAFSGLMLAAVLDLPKAQIKPMGIILLMIYVFAYALSSIYFSGLKLSLSREVFNVWQVFVGGIILSPLSLFFHQSHVTHWDFYLWGSLAWLIVVLSFIANQLWLYLINLDTVKAANWLYLVPGLGYIYGYVLLHEHITWYAICGTIMVIAGLIISKGVKTSKQ